jgi:hypothetical protein
MICLTQSRGESGENLNVLVWAGLLHPSEFCEGRAPAYCVPTQKNEV